MQRVGDRYIYSISDLNDHAGCAHLASLERAVANRSLTPPNEVDEALALIARKGNEHELRYLAELRSTFGDGVVECDASPVMTIAGMEKRALATADAMRAGADILYQPSFFDGVFWSRADFLRKVERPSALGAWSYEAIDTKLAQRAKGRFLLQLCHYSEHVARVQGAEPAKAYVVLGNGAEKSFILAEYTAYYRARKKHFLAAQEIVVETYPEQCAHCTVCRWIDSCDARRDADDDLSLIANMRKDAALKLRMAGIDTVEKLAHAGDDVRPVRVTRETFERLRAQARLQHRARVAARAGEKRYEYEFLPAVAGSGFALLPEPDRGDIFFDIEGDPLYAPDRGLEYLFGFHLASEGRFQPFWALSSEAERTTFEAVVDFCIERARTYPQMHIYHYAPYEISALRRLSTRYGTREAEVDALLRSERFIDLYAVVRQSLRISQPSYSIKKLEPFYDMRRSTNVLRGDDSVVQFEAFLATRDETILRDIEQYNTDDCLSTMLLRNWLLERRAEYIERHGPLPELVVPGADDDDDDADVNSDASGNADAAEKRLAREQAVAERCAAATELLDGLKIDGLDDLRAANPAERARYLLGNFIEYHAREDKPEHWKYFDRLRNKDTLVEGDHEALGELTFVEEITLDKMPRNRRVYAYSYPEQKHNLGKGKTVRSTELGSTTLGIISLDEDARRICVTLPEDFSAISVRNLIPYDIIPTKSQREVLLRAAHAWRQGDWTGFPAARDILLANPPRISGIAMDGILQPDDVSANALHAIIANMHDTCLVVQGPPGTGKTTKHAEVIVRLLAAGKRVGITASKHKAVHNLLAKIEDLGVQRAFRFTGFHKAGSKTDDTAFISRHVDACVTTVTSYAPFKKMHQLASGTQWMFSKLAADESEPYDYLFIDEAGQLSTADALACSFAARNVVLLGDPLQLAHVSQGEHPPGSALSVLEHMLGADATIRPERGVFLDTSYRMSPAICGFLSAALYENRLRSGTNTAGNRVIGAVGETLAGSGLRYIPVVHQGNGRSSREECAEIAERVREILQAEIVIGNEPARRACQSDILIVAPYNAQRAALGAALTKAGYNDIRVGTVDLFQGLEAAVVIYSMAASDGESIPRGAEFLLEKNRVNVGLSRAQCLAVIVCSPELPRMDCETPEQMALVNLLCRFVEDATELGAITQSALR